MGISKYLLCRRILDLPQTSSSPPAMLMAKAEMIRIYNPFLSRVKPVIWLGREVSTVSS
jgi:hypothetical protein